MLAILWLAVAPQGQSTVPKDVLLLARIEQHMADRLAHLPDFTCLETIERFSRPAARYDFRYMDTVQVEVAHAGDKELFAWPGARAFSDQDTGELVQYGASSTGEFALHLRSIFMSHTATIRFRGEEEMDGRRLMRYDFKVPLLGSTWAIRYANAVGEAATRGSFWADPESLEVVRLENHADEISPNVPVSSLASRTDYAPVRIGAQDIWLPQGSEVRLIDNAGAEHRNRIEFSHCRQFGTSSEISFEQARPEPAPARPAEITLPADLGVPVRLETLVDSDEARVGDRIAASVTADVRSGKTVVIPRGAVLRGRVRRMHSASVPAEHFEVGLEFTELEFGDRRGQFFAQLVHIGPVPGLEYRIGKSTRRGNVLRTDYTLAPEIPGVGTFLMRGKSFRLEPGLAMVWRTIELRR